MFFFPLHQGHEFAVLPQARHHAGRGGERAGSLRGSPWGGELHGLMAMFMV